MNLNPFLQGSVRDHVNLTLFSRVKPAIRRIEIPFLRVGRYKLKLLFLGLSVLDLHRDLVVHLLQAMST